METNIDRADKVSLAILDAIESDSDPRESLAALRARIRHLKETGRSVPVALITAERQLLVELSAQSQGR